APVTTFGFTFLRAALDRVAESPSKPQPHTRLACPPLQPQRSPKVVGRRRPVVHRRYTGSTPAAAVSPMPPSLGRVWQTVGVVPGAGRRPAPLKSGGRRPRDT